MRPNRVCWSPITAYGLHDLGFRGDLTQPRVAAQLLAGRLSFGSFVIKVTLVRSRGLLSCLLPVAGSVLAALIVVVWSTSSFWGFHTVGFQRQSDLALSGGV